MADPEARAWHRLALALGYPVGMLQQMMTRDEFVRWLAFYQLEPWGEIRGDYRAGVVAATVANTQRGKRQKPYSPSDFMVDWETEIAGQDWKAMQMRLRAAFGGKG